MEEDEEKKKRNIFPFIFFASLLALFLFAYFIVHPIVDKPPEISPAERVPIQKEKAGDLEGAIEEYKNLINKEINEGRKCIYRTRIARLYSQLGKNDIAKGYYETAESIAKEKNFSSCMYEVMFWRGYYEKNISFLMKAVEIAENLNDNKKRFYSYSQLGNYYLNLQNFAKAKEIYGKAIVLSNYGDHRTIGYNYMGIGMVYSEWNIYQHALQNLKQAEIYLKKANDKEGLLNTYLRIAYIYAKNNDSKNAVIYYEKANEISNITMDRNIKLGIAYGYVISARKKLDEKNYNGAIDDAKKALNLYTELHGDEQVIATAKNILCYGYFATKKRLEAIECYIMLEIEALANDLDKFEAYIARASLNEFFALRYKGMEIGVVEDEKGEFKRIDMFCQRILMAIDDYKKAKEIGKKINMSEEEIKIISNKILKLEEKGKECEN